MRLRSLDKYRRYYMFPQNRCIFLDGIHVLLFSSLQNVTYVLFHANIILLLQYVFLQILRRKYLQWVSQYSSFL